MVVRTLGVPPPSPRIYIWSWDRTSLYIDVDGDQSPDASPGLLATSRPTGPGKGVGRAGPPANWSDLGVSKDLSVSKTAPGLKICRGLVSPVRGPARARSRLEG
jgi:hypothetical protein